MVVKSAGTRVAGAKNFSALLKVTEAEYREALLRAIGRAVRQ
jgi:hypothetical protein